MLDWLSNLSQKPDHPMHNIEEAERLLTGLSDDPLKALEEVAAWLTTLTQAAGFRLATRFAVMRLVDETGQPIERDVNRLYLTPGALTEFERLQLWKIALQFWERLEHAYRLCLHEIQHNPKLLRAHNEDLPQLTVRIARALANQIRLAHMRYMPVREPLRQSLYDLYGAAEQAGYDNQRVTAYPDDAMPTTARQELLRAMLLETARPDSMPQRHTDITARATARYASACLFEQKPKAGCNWAFDLALPRPPELAIVATSPQATARYFGAGAVIVKIEEVIKRLTSQPQDMEQRFGEEYTSQEKLDVMRRLTRYWGNQPPQPREKRSKITATIDVARGLAQAFRQIPRAPYRGWAELMIGLDVKLKERLGIIVDPAAVNAPEKWKQFDGSLRGLAAAIPRAGESHVRIGALCSLQMGNNTWWIGVVRRLFRNDDEQLNAGIELLAKAAATVLLRRVGHGGMSMQDWSKASDASGNDYLNALLLNTGIAGRQVHELLLARGEFIAGIVYEAMLGEHKQHFRLEELLEEGEDFARVKFAVVAGNATHGAPAA
jgi:hypothetical protein